MGIASPKRIDVNGFQKSPVIGSGDYKIPLRVSPIWLWWRIAAILCICSLPYCWWLAQGLTMWCRIDLLIVRDEGCLAFTRSRQCWKWRYRIRKTSLKLSQKVPFLWPLAAEGCFSHCAQRQSHRIGRLATMQRQMWRYEDMDFYQRRHKHFRINEK